MSRPVAKALNKRYRSTVEMLENTGTSQEIIDSVKEVENQVAVPLLAGLRVSKGMTQKELAQAIGCSQGRISKLETMRDEEVRLQDFIDYTLATNQKVWIEIGRSTIADHIKLLTRALREAFEELATLAGEDEQIREGVDDFLDEILVETGRMAESAKAKLARKEEQKPEFEFRLFVSRDAAGQKWPIPASSQKVRIPESRGEATEKAS